MKTTLRLRSFLLASGALLSAPLAQGATYTWSDSDNGTAVSANWSTGTSWSAAPVSAADTTLSFGWTFGVNSTAETNTLTNDVANPFLLNVLTFTGSPTAANGTNVATVNITGSPLNFVDNGASAPVVNLNANRSNGQGVVFNVQSDVTLGNNITFQGSGTATYTFSGIISGTGFGFTKSGTSTLTLTGNNDFTGGTTLSAGTLILGHNNALGTNGLTVTGNSTIGFLNGVNISNAIDRGTSTVTYYFANTAGGSATYSGALTGTGTINITNSNSGNNTSTINFTNAGNFTGNVVGAAGNANGADYASFTSIGDGGNFTFNKSGNRGGIILNGTSDMTFNTRQIALGTSFGGASGGGGYGLNGNGIPVNSIQNNSAANTVTFNTNMSAGAFASSGIFYFDGSNTGNNTFAGTIGDATGANTLGIGKWGAGKWILTGSNSYEGNTFIANGTLSANMIDVAANNQPLGKGSLILFGYNATNGTLEFTGSSNSSTDKQVQVGNTNNNHAGGGIILNNGSGSLTFSNPAFNTAIGGLTSVTRTLTLGGGYDGSSGVNEIQGVLQNNTTTVAKLNLAVSGSVWKLSGTNTYTGTTTVSGGTLVLGSADALPGGIGTSGGTSNLTFNGGVVGLAAGDFTRSLNSAATVTAATFTGAGGWAAYGADRNVNLGGSSGTITWATANTGFNSQTLIFGASTATHKVTLQNNVDLGNATRTIRVIKGLGAVDAEMSGVISGTTGNITVGGSGTLYLSNANSFTGKVIMGDNTAGGTLKVQVNSIKDVSGGNSSLGAPTTSANGLIQIGLTSNHSTLEFINLGGNQSTNRQIQIGSSAGGSGGAYILNNDASSTVTFSNAAFNVAATGTSTFNRVLRLGGSNTGNNTIQGAIIDNVGTSGGKISLTKQDSGTWVLSGTNTYTGSTTISNGTLIVNGTGSINNTSGVTIGSGATFRYNSSVAYVGGTIANNGGTIGGNGLIGVSVTLDSTSDTLAPGNSPGIQEYTTTQTWNSFTYQWDVNDFSGTSAGTDFDQIQITGLAGSLSLTGSVAGSYVLDLISLAGLTPGDVANFSEITTSWNIITTTQGISGFNEAYWTINTAGFTTNLSSPEFGGTWSIGTGNGGKDLVLTYTAVPEPGAALLGSLGLLALLRRRRN